MKFSIITPCYNGERYIDRCVTSVLAQREAGVDLQYTVMDACSTDATLERLRTYGAAIDRIKSEPDRGPADAINKGIALSDGEIVGWLNADDTYEPP
jgi:glycosyltransferase involved in cell wall biosynthesis